MPAAHDPDVLSPRLAAFSVEVGALAELIKALPDDSVLALPVPSAGLATTGAVADALSAVGLPVSTVRDTWEPVSSAGSSTRIPLGQNGLHVRSVLLVGVGEATPTDLRAAGATVGRATRGRPSVVSTIGSGASAAAQGAFVEGVALGGWHTPRWSGSEPAKDSAPVGVVHLVGSFDQGTVDSAVVGARATAIARGLGIVPSNLKNPAWMAAQARTLGRRSGLTVAVHDEVALRREGFGGLLAVGGGSATPPRLVRLDYEPSAADASTPRIVLVGKGITFDSGGLDIKPAAGMLAMKTDMMGSAVVLAVLSACRDLGVTVRVTGLLCLAENAVSGASYRPGDVITQYGGRTVEIGNTDAEGRLVLADGLAYADAQLDPDVLLDIATLTGAARVALDRTQAPVYATDDRLRAQLVAAGEVTGETLCPFPLVEDYRSALDSEVADLNHIATKPVGGGSIVAALFLREFAGDRAWAHLDVAGVGRSDVDRGIQGIGATAFGTRLLLTWLRGRS